MCVYMCVEYSPTLYTCSPNTVNHRGSVKCTRFLGRRNIELLCEHWGVQTERWHGSCNLEQLPEVIMREIYTKGVSVPVDTNVQHVVHGLAVNTSYSFERGHHWLGVFMELKNPRG